MDMTQFAYALHKIVLTFSLTRHTLFPVSPGMCHHFYCFIEGNTLSLYLTVVLNEQKKVRKINKVTNK